MSEDRCIICGEIIPEGRQVCPNCEKGLVSLKIAKMDKGELKFEQIHLSRKKPRKCNHPKEAPACSFHYNGSCMRDHNYECPALVKPMKNLSHGEMVQIAEERRKPMIEIAGITVFLGDEKGHWIPDDLIPIIDALAEEYRIAVTLPHVRKKKAYSLYQVWKEVDRKEKTDDNQN